MVFAAAAYIKPVSGSAVAIPVTSKAVADDADSKTAQSSTGAVASAPRQAYMTAFDTEEKPLVTVRLPVSDPTAAFHQPTTDGDDPPAVPDPISVHPEGVAGIPEVEFVSRMTRTSSAASPAGYGTSMVPAADAFSASVPTPTKSTCGDGAPRVMSKPVPPLGVMSKATGSPLGCYVCRCDAVVRAVVGDHIHGLGVVVPGEGVGAVT